jgi:hypothetical protein
MTDHERADTKLDSLVMVCVCRLSGTGSRRRSGSCGNFGVEIALVVKS